MSEHEDLEDGEIEDDEEDVVAEVVTVPDEEERVDSGPVTLLTPGEWDDEIDKPRDVHEKVHSVKDTTETKVRRSPKPTKRSKPGPVVDDWATSVENAIANALKKDGVQPPMPSMMSRQDEQDGETPPKRRRREKHKKKVPLEKLVEMEEIDLEYEMLNVRGGSPRPMLASATKPDGSDSEDSYTSEDSRDRERERNRDRERRDRDRERDREYNRRKRKNRQRNRGNRDNRKRKKEESDDEKHHRSSGPRKMELCKFYLMDCCAKRDKCLYMHSDFPCKYYYLGLKCKDKEKCLFSHGEPLTDELRAILMKHLETAPQEILGDFPRIGRESAATMVAATHRKLLDKFGVTDKAITTAEGSEGKIPSLLDMLGSSDRNNKGRRSRWCDKTSGKAGGGLGEDILSVKLLNGVISQEQIVNLEQMGVRTLDEISHLTVAQLNELGLSIGQIHELQLNALNMRKLRENIKHESKDEDNEMEDIPAGAHPKDMDMRVTPAHTSPQQDTSEIPSLGGKDVDMRFLPLVSSTRPEDASGEGSNVQDDNLDLVSASLTSLKTPTVDYSQYLKDSNLNDEDDMDNTENTDNLLIDQGDEDDDDENSLKINIEEDDHEETNRDDECWDSPEPQSKHEDTVLQPQPAVFDSKLINRSISTQKIDYTKPFGMYKPNDEESEQPVETYSFGRYSDNEALKKKIEPFGRKSMYNSNNNSTFENVGSSSPSALKQMGSPSSTPPVGWSPVSASVVSSGINKVTSHTSKSIRSSIYDDPYTSDSSEDGESKSKMSMYTDRDKDMRLNFLNLDSKIGEDGSSIGDVDLRLPFKPIMTNYIPATEIDASITSHPPIIYKVQEVDIPKPNYKDIRRNTPRPERTKDPRLRRIFRMGAEDDESTSRNDPLLPGLRSPKMTSIPATGPVMPRMDPRTKRSQEIKNQSHSANPSSSGINNPSTHLDVQTILQRSSWYTDLSSKHKIMVNQQLAILSTEMKKYHNSDKSTEKSAEFMQQLAANQMLQYILTNLNVYVDDSVAFCEVPLVPQQPPPLMSVPPPNMGMPPMAAMLPPVNIPPPVQKPPSLFDLPRFNCPPEVRPGLLGVAPNMPFEKFLAMGQINKNNNPPPLLEEWNDDYEWDENPGGNSFTPSFERNSNNFGRNNNNNNMRNNNRTGNNFRNNDRWNNSGGGNNPNRRNNNHRRMDKKK